jgi:hypothetical protein
MTEDPAMFQDGRRQDRPAPETDSPERGTPAMMFERVAPARVRAYKPVEGPEPADGRRSIPHSSG